METCSFKEYYWISFKHLEQYHNSYCWSPFPDGWQELELPRMRFWRCSKLATRRMEAVLAILFLDTVAISREFFWIFAEEMSAIWLLGASVDISEGLPSKEWMLIEDTSDMAWTIDFIPVIRFTVSSAICTWKWIRWHCHIKREQKKIRLYIAVSTPCKSKPAIYLPLLLKFQGQLSELCY